MKELAEGAPQKEIDLELARQIINRGTGLETKHWLPIWQEFKETIADLTQPLGHGTSTTYLESILQLGLGAVKPANAFTPNLNSLCDLHFPDGLLATYSFATWNETHKLAVNAAKITGRDVVDRYAEVNPHLDSRFKKFLLRQMAHQYLKKRGPQTGLATLLVYDGEGIAPCHYRGRNVDSEVDCLTILPADQLRYVFVPATQVPAVSRLLDSHAAPARLLPLELFELEEIRFHAKT